MSDNANSYRLRIEEPIGEQTSSFRRKLIYDSSGEAHDRVDGTE
jgi:hypothetical protein